MAATYSGPTSRPNRCTNKSNTFFKTSPAGNTNANRWTATVDADVNGAAAEYFTTLKQSIRDRAMRSMREGAGRWTMRDELRHTVNPDEELESYAAVGMAVPLRRRDRLQELLLLERKHRIIAQQKARAAQKMRLQQSATEGALEDGGAVADGTGGVDEDLDAQLREIYKEELLFGEKGTGTAPEGRFLGTDEDLTTRSDERRRRRERRAAEEAWSSTSSTPELDGSRAKNGRCSARADLTQCLSAVEVAARTNPNSAATSRALRAEVQKQKDKWHQQLNECGEPHECYHCFATDAQWRYVPADCTGVPIENPRLEFFNRSQTWKVGSTKKGAGTGDRPLASSAPVGMGLTAAAADGASWRATTGGAGHAAGGSKKPPSRFTADGHLKGYNPHPFGTGVVWMPLKTPSESSTDEGGADGRPSATPPASGMGGAAHSRPAAPMSLSHPTAATVGSATAADSYYNHPGGVYGGYPAASQQPSASSNAHSNSRIVNGDGSSKKVNFITPQPSRDESGSDRSRSSASATGSNVSAVVPNKPWQSDVMAAAALPHESASSNPSSAMLPPIASGKSMTTSALWMTTNQERENDLRRYMAFVKDNEKLLYTANAASK